MAWETAANVAVHTPIVYLLGIVIKRQPGQHRLLLKNLVVFIVLSHFTTTPHPAVNGLSVHSGQPGLLNTLDWVWS